jgi:mannitol-1-phosphate 5-dehydrogenase
VVEAPSLKEPRPHIKGWQLTHHLPAYNERKLFTLNTGHAIAAYLGFLKGLATIDEAIRDEEVHAVVRGALGESGAALVKKHGFKQEEHDAYITKIEERFKNKAVRDEVARVGRQPLRKLGREDRLVGPTIMARQQGVKVQHLPVGIAAALRYDDSTDEQSRELQKDIKEKGIEVVVQEITGFDDGTEEHQKIVEAYHSLDKFKAKV